MSVPREVSLETVDGDVRLVQQPVRELRRLRGEPAYQAQAALEGTHTLEGRGARGKTLEIRAELDPRAADRLGLKVRVGDGEETAIGCDAETEELYIDRTRSGDVGFSPSFPGVHRAPLPLDRHGDITLRILVDWSSVEVFADRGQVTITDQVFPRPASEQVQLFADGGSAEVESLEIRPLRSAWSRRGS